MADGLIDELTRAASRPDLARGPAQVIGMGEARAVAAGDIDIAQFEEAVNVRTRRLARMQGTWMRRMCPDLQIDLGDGPPEAAVASIAAAWRRAREGVG
jgi:tRNA A37 N6-isopentenylltransferase MiaA